MEKPAKVTTDALELKATADIEAGKVFGRTSSKEGEAREGDSDVALEFFVK
jgi:hypothetical protein